MQRREFLRLLALATAAGASLRPGASEAQAADELYELPRFGNVSLLHFTDSHAQLLPIYFREPDVNIGVGAAAGHPPHLVGEALLKQFGILGTLMLNNRAVLRVYPPLVITEAEVDEVLDALASSMSELAGDVDSCFVSLLHPEERERVLAAIKEQMAAAGAYEMEFRLRTKAGDWRWVLSRGRVVARDARGRGLRIVGTHRDITPRVLAREELRRERDLAQLEDIAMIGDLQRRVWNALPAVREIE